MEWIKTTDSLPTVDKISKFSEELLIVVNNSLYKNKTLHGFRFYGDRFSDCMGDFSIGEVTYWMPLPSPPSVDVTLDEDKLISTIQKIIVESERHRDNLHENIHTLISKIVDKPKTIEEIENNLNMMDGIKFNYAKVEGIDFVLQKFKLTLFFDNNNKLFKDDSVEE